ncbi:MAG: hypothetical protein ACPGVD_01785 [Flavobacteriales bacterium]
MDDSIIDDVFNEEPKEKKADYRAYFIWIFLLLVASLFKIMHWPFGSLLSLLAYAGMMSFSLIALLFYKDYKRVNFIMLGLTIIHVVTKIYSFISKDDIGFNSFWLYSFLGATGIISLVYYLIYSVKKPI